MMATRIAPQIAPRISEQIVLTTQARKPAGTRVSRWWTNWYGACQPSSSTPTRMMWPPTHSIANVPMTPMIVRTTGIALTRPSPNFPAKPSLRLAMARPMSSIFTSSPTTP